MAQNFQIDKLDRQILSMLIKDSTIPYTEIAKDLVISAGTVHVRMKKLHDMGIVKGTTLVIDHSKLGYDLTAFIGVYLEKGSVYDKVIRKLEKIPEVAEAYYTTGVYSIFMKIICRNTFQLREILNDHIQAIEGIQRTETILSLGESIKRPVKLSA